MKGGRDNWARTLLGEICLVEDGKRIPINQKERDQRVAGKHPSELYRYFGATGQVGWIDGYIFDGTRVLLGEDGAPFFDRSKTTAYMVHGRYWVNNHAHVLDPWIDSGFLCHQLNQVDYHGHVTGTTRAKLNQKAMREIPLWIAPLVEQRAIVAKIESLFSELDQGVAQLEAVRAQLGRYRQSVLKAAFEGRLTAAWRDERGRTAEAKGEALPTAGDLLARIRAERASAYAARLAQWERAVAAWEAAGGKVSGHKKPRKPAAPKGPVEPSPDEQSKLADLPDGWCWIKLATLGDLARGKSRHRPRNAAHLYDGPYPFVQTGDIKAADRILRTYSQTYSEAGLAQSRLWPTGTLCITIAANIAETAFLGFDGCFPDSVVGFTANRRVVEPNYVEFFIQSARLRIAAFAPATAQKNINLTTLEELVVPTCSLDEQKLLVSELDSAFSVIADIERTIAAALKQAEALRQSILKKAFEGRLLSEAEIAAVRADPDYEPADKLLARIRSSDGSSKPPTKKTRRKRKAKETA